MSAPFAGILDLYQDNDFDPQKCWDAGIRLVIHKAGQWPDSEFSRNEALYSARKAAWLELGGKWGSYFLPFAGATISEMLNAWYDCDGKDDILRAIDWEGDGSGQMVSELEVSEIVKAVFQASGRLPIIYGSNTLTERTADATIDACPLWYANPTGDLKPPQFFAPNHPPAGDLRFWQWTDGDGSPEFDGADLNVFNGTEEELMAWFP